MADKREVVIVGAARTPIGAYGGSLKDFTACDLGAHVVKAAFARAEEIFSIGQAIPDAVRQAASGGVAAVAADDFDWPRQQGFTVVTAEECWGKSLEPLMAQVRQTIGNAPCYITMRTHLGHGFK